jgi:hypothetical protein
MLIRVIKLNCIVLCVLFFVECNSCFGKTFQKNEQTDNTLLSTVHYGFKIGLNSSNFSQNNQRNKIECSAGLTANYSISPFLGIEADLFYSLEGARQADPSVFYYSSSITMNNMKKINSNLSFHTIEMPWLICLKVPGSNNMEPKLMIGAALNYYAIVKTANLIYDQADDIMLSERTKEDVSSSFKHFNYSAVVGTGIDFNGTKLGCSIEIRYKFGLNTINSIGNYNVTYSYHEDFSMNSLQVLFGISFYN